jgi:hypothetical protein
VQLRRQCETETSAAVCRLIVGANVSTMRFNDRAGNRQTKSHPGVLGREKAIEEMIEVLWLDARAAVFEGAA